MTTVPRRLGALALTALLVAACTQPAIDEAEARAAAAGFLAGSAPLGTSIEGIDITSARFATRDGRTGWEVEIEGTPMAQGQVAGVTYYWILFIDGTSGEVTILGQG